MTKQEAIERFVREDLAAIPQEWVKIVAEAKGGYHGLPMWGTMWFMNFPGAENVYENARTMLGDKSELRDEAEACTDEEKKAKLLKAIEEDDWAVLADYIDEEMSGERCVLDKDGNTTAMFVYEIEGEYLLGVNGAGWNFYDGVWDKLYDLLGLKWHE